MKLARIGAPAGYALASFAAVLLHAGALGPTDDEAYYWALSDHPSLGFAYHPPGIVWTIAAARAGVGWLFESPHPIVLRLPAAFFTATILFLALQWVRSVAGPRARLGMAGAVIVSFAGFFGASWMAVPDLPMFAGWMMMFHATWAILRQTKGWAPPVMLAGGTALCLLGKFSGVLAVASSAFSIVAWAPPKRRAPALGWLAAGTVAGLLPSLAWNASHSWDAVLYQIRDRHGGAGASLTRYARFWGSQLLLAGPPLVIHAAAIGWRARSSGRAPGVTRYAVAWAAPAAAVFLIQPLFSEFKPHWALAAWFPAVLELAALSATGRSIGFAKAQLAYGIPLLMIAVTACHVPVLGLIARTAKGEAPDPRLDVTNDMYGWDQLKGRVDPGVPVLGSRYQTAGQAAFALGTGYPVSRVPRERRELDEWPDLGVTDSTGPGWPRLLRPVQYVSDNRYSAPPDYRGAKCAIRDTIEATRFGLPAKRIDIWHCEPK